MLVYAKGGVIKHIKAPVIVKVELIDLLKIQHVRMRKRVQDFITNCTNSFISVSV